MSLFWKPIKERKIERKSIYILSRFLVGCHGFSIFSKRQILWNFTINGSNAKCLAVLQPKKAILAIVGV
jgi:hypothetical protein